MVMNHLKQSNRITTRQIIVVVIGLSLTMLMVLVWTNSGSNRFFSLLIRFRGKYLNEAYFLLIGLVIFGFGLYDIYKTLQNNKK